jgi:hypothetical protein
MATSGRGPKRWPSRQRRWAVCYLTQPLAKLLRTCRFCPRAYRAAVWPSRQNTMIDGHTRGVCDIQQGAGAMIGKEAEGGCLIGQGKLGRGAVWEGAVCFPKGPTGILCVYIRGADPRWLTTPHANGTPRCSGPLGRSPCMRWNPAIAPGRSNSRESRSAQIGAHVGAAGVATAELRGALNS